MRPSGTSPMALDKTRTRAEEERGGHEEEDSMDSVTKNLFGSEGDEEEQQDRDSGGNGEGSFKYGESDDEGGDEAYQGEENADKGSEEEKSDGSEESMDGEGNPTVSELGKDGQWRKVRRGGKVGEGGSILRRSDRANKGTHPSKGITGAGGTARKARGNTSGSTARRSSGTKGRGGLNKNWRTPAEKAGGTRRGEGGLSFGEDTVFRQKKPGRHDTTRKRSKPGRSDACILSLTEPRELEDATEPRRPGGVRHRQRARRKMEDVALSMPMVQSALDLSMPLEQLNLELSMPLTQSGPEMSLPPGDSAAGDDEGAARESVRLEGDGAAPGGDLVRAGFLAGVTALLFAAAAFAVKARQDRRGRDSGYDADSERDEREEAADVGGDMRDDPPGDVRAQDASFSSSEQMRRVLSFTTSEDDFHSASDGQSREDQPRKLVSFALDLKEFEGQEIAIV